MAPVIRIPDNLYKRLETKAKGFVTPANIIEELLEFWENNNGDDYSHQKVSGITLSDPATYKIEEDDHKEYRLAALQQEDLTKSRPFAIIIEDKKIRTNNWSDACLKLVDWLVQNDHLSNKDLPILNAAGRDKYFINSKPVHSLASMDGEWKEVSENIWIDVKYNAKYHVRNMTTTLKALGLSESILKIQL